MIFPSVSPLYHCKFIQRTTLFFSIPISQQNCDTSQNVCVTILKPIILLVCGSNINHDKSPNSLYSGDFPVAQNTGYYSMRAITGETICVHLPGAACKNVIKMLLRKKYSRVLTPARAQQKCVETNGTMSRHMTKSG